MASMMEKFKANYAGNKAYQAHATANRMLDAHRYAEAQQNFDKAMELYEQAIALGCDKLGILMAYSLLLMRYGRPEEARDLMLSLEKRPDVSHADRNQLRINYSVCQWKLGNVDKAIELMKQVGEGGMTGMIYNTLGLFLVEKAAQTGDFAEAIDFCAKAYEYDDEDADTLDNLGQLHLAMSRKASAEGEADKAAEEWKSAKDYFDRALERRPAQVTSLYYRAVMSHADGENEKARKALEKALTSNIGTLCPISRSQIEALLKEVGE